MTIIIFLAVVNVVLLSTLVVRELVLRGEIEQLKQEKHNMLNAINMTVDVATETIGDMKTYVDDLEAILDNQK